MWSPGSSARWRWIWCGSVDSSEVAAPGRSPIGSSARRSTGSTDAPAPAKVGKIVASKINVELPDSSAIADEQRGPLVDRHVVGSGGRDPAGVSSPRRASRRELVTGVAAWGTSYAVLPQLGVYKPIDRVRLENAVEGPQRGSCLRIGAGRRHVRDRWRARPRQAARDLRRRGSGSSIGAYNPSSGTRTRVGSNWMRSHPRSRPSFESIGRRWIVFRTRRHGSRSGNGGASTPTRRSNGSPSAGRGGYCFHLNGSLGRLLTMLGDDVSLHVGGVHRVEPDGGRSHEPSGADGRGPAHRRQPWRPVVRRCGVGDGLYEPLPLRAGRYRQGPFVFELAETPDGIGDWHFTHDPEGSFASMGFRAATATLDEFVDTHRHLSTSPDSGFVRNVTAQCWLQNGVTWIRSLTRGTRDRHRRRDELRDRQRRVVRCAGRRVLPAVRRCRRRGQGPPVDTGPCFPRGVARYAVSW